MASVPKFQPSAIILSFRYGQENNEVSIQDQKAWALITACIENYMPLVITNRVMGGDTSPKNRKRCVLTYTFNGLTRTRYAYEYDTMDFSWDVTRIEYGTTTQYWSNDYYLARPNISQHIFNGLYNNVTLGIRNETMLERPADRDDDPHFGQEKEARIWYMRCMKPGRGEQAGIENVDYVKRVLTIKEGGTGNFSK